MSNVAMKHKVRNANIGSDTEMVSGATQNASDKKEKNGKSSEEELKKIEALCKELGVPIPNEIYVIPREYEKSGNPNLIQYSTVMPKELSKWVNETQFEITMDQINSTFGKAQQINCGTAWNGFWKFMTCYMIRACRKSKMEKAIIKVQKEIFRENETVYHPIGLHVVGPAARGFRHVEFRSITFYSMKQLLDREKEAHANESGAAKLQKDDKQPNEQLPGVSS